LGIVDRSTSCRNHRQERDREDGRNRTRLGFNEPHKHWQSSTTEAWDLRN
jgi:hypothetical protein